MRPRAPTRRDALARIGYTSLLLAAPQLARGASVLAVRVWPAEAYTRVTIESDEALSARHFVTDGPYRLAIDLDNIELSPELKELVGKVRPDDPYIERVRVGQFQARLVRLVVDLKQPVRPEQFSLTPVAAYRHRLVFDLYPKQERDPLLALVREKQGAEDKAARAVNDALGELIAKVDKPLPLPGAASGAPAAPQAGASGGSAAPAAAPAPAAPAPATPAPKPQKPPTDAEREKVDRLVIVALDPGHGGEDPGAIGPSGLREKDVVLAIAKQLREALNTERRMRVLLTRDADYFVPLYDRVKKARAVQADLFVSIHADAFMRPEARGASVFALSTRGASSAAARWMAQRENASDRIGGANTGDVELQRVMLDMSTTAQIRDSLLLGREVLGRIGRVGNLHKKQVEQAGFAVLKAPDIPSILVETGFISNPEEEDKLRDPEHQRALVQAIATGIRRYFAKNPPLARQRSL